MIKDLVYYNSPTLRQRCNEVEKVNDDVRSVVQHLTDTVAHHNGAGLAAPQIGYLLRIFVICYAREVEADGSPVICPAKVFINPEITYYSEEESIYPEGCLSIPGLHEDVVRSKKITVKAMDLNGKEFEETVTDWRARVILHELDHLEGVLYIDRLPKSLRERLEEPLSIIDSKLNHKK